jgi:hypothetical protein
MKKRMLEKFLKCFLTLFELISYLLDINQGIQYMVNLMHKYGLVLSVILIIILCFVLYVYALRSIISFSRIQYVGKKRLLWFFIEKKKIEFS